MAVLRSATLLTRWRAALLVLVGTVGLAGCGSEPVPTAPPTTSASTFEQERTDGLDRLLEAWGTAVRSDDVAALRSLFDSSADPAFVDAEIRRAQNLVGVPLAEFGYRIDPDTTETPVPSETADAIAGATDVWAPPVVLRYAYAGADIGPTSRPVALLVARRGDDWKLVSDSTLPGSTRTTWRGPWDFGSVVVRSVDTAGTTSLVLGHEDRRATIDALAAETAAAVPAVTDFWGVGWSRRAVVVVASSDAEFAATTGTTTSNTDTAATTVSDPVTSGLVTGQRVVFSPGAQDRLTDFTRSTVLRHELTHVAARVATVDTAPLWMLEGFADYSGYRGSGRSFTELAPTLAAVVRAAGPPRVLPIDADFGAGGARGATAYESAWSVSAYVADRFGEPMLRTLYRAVAAGPSNPTVLDANLRRTLGVGTDDFLNGWGAWVNERANS
ncbi:hypothetical protein GCM10007304_19150 [Rhodococcoides trifolii]|uniref:Peptidase n=1 Tax=Rhodococcoides trifolii TaxID=908250 RepID=A0A917D281_9NOCA|nr:hypothetical protein [Rhodococcus trifolii]GGG05241.1 hypothetical protein GCM10007304_19150 [Rhodococcus trifolii]